MLTLIQKNFTLKLLSLGLAVLAWAYFNYAANPVITARFDQQFSVPIVVRGVPSGYVTNGAERSVVVTITAPRGGTAAIRPDDIKAYVDVAGRPPGVYNMPIKISAPRDIKSTVPSSVTLSIDRVVSSAYAVSVNYVGKLHGALVAKAPHIEPKAVMVTGPSTAIGLINAVRVDVPLEAIHGNMDTMLKPIASDVDGHEVAGVRLTPNLVRVRIAFVKS